MQICAVKSNNKQTETFIMKSDHNIIITDLQSNSVKSMSYGIRNSLPINEAEDQ